MGRTRTYRVSRRVVSKRRKTSQNITKRVNKRVKKTRSRRVKRTNRVRKSGRNNYRGGGFWYYSDEEKQITELFEKKVFGSDYRRGAFSGHLCFITGMLRAGVEYSTLNNFFNNENEMLSLAVPASNFDDFVVYMISIGIVKSWFVGKLTDFNQTLKDIWSAAGKFIKIDRMGEPTQLDRLPKLIVLGSLLKHKANLNIDSHTERAITELASFRPP